MKYAEVAENVKRLLDERPSNDEFVYELLLAYGTPKATVARLKKGQLNLAKEPGEVLLKKKLWFKPAAGDLLAAMEELKSAKATKSNDPRFLIVTDFEQLLAVDRKTADTLDVELNALETNFDFFLPWAGIEKTKLSNENPADVKAAENRCSLNGYLSGWIRRVGKDLKPQRAQRNTEGESWGIVREGASAKMRELKITVGRGP